MKFHSQASALAVLAFSSSVLGHEHLEEGCPCSKRDVGDSAITDYHHHTDTVTATTTATGITTTTETVMLVPPTATTVTTTIPPELLSSTSTTIITDSTATTTLYAAMGRRNLPDDDESKSPDPDLVDGVRQVHVSDGDVPQMKMTMNPLPKSFRRPGYIEMNPQQAILAPRDLDHEHLAEGCPCSSTSPSGAPAARDLTVVVADSSTTLSTTLTYDGSALSTPVMAARDGAVYPSINKELVFIPGDDVVNASSEEHIPDVAYDYYESHFPVADLYEHGDDMVVVTGEHSQGSLTYTHSETMPVSEFFSAFVGDVRDFAAQATITESATVDQANALVQPSPRAVAQSVTVLVSATASAGYQPITTTQTSRAYEETIFINPPVTSSIPTIISASSSTSTETQDYLETHVYYPHISTVTKILSPTIVSPTPVPTATVIVSESASASAIVMVSVKPGPTVTEIISAPAPPTVTVQAPQTALPTVVETVSAKESASAVIIVTEDVEPKVTISPGRTYSQAHTRTDTTTYMVMTTVPPTTRTGRDVKLETTTTTKEITATTTPAHATGAASRGRRSLVLASTALSALLTAVALF